MASINDLPTELMAMITPHLNRREIVALRHGSRRLRTTTSAAFIPTFEYLSTSCSRLGIFRVLALIREPDEEQKQQVLRTIKRVTIHLPIPADLKDLAGCLQRKYENVYLRAYRCFQNTLYDFLALLSNLELVTITNEPLKFDDRLDDRQSDKRPRRAARITEIPGIDPFLACLKNGPKRRPRTYGYEVVLVALYHLEKHVPVHLVIDHKYTRHLKGRAFVTWDMKNEFPGRCHPQLQATMDDLFGPEPNMWYILRSHLSELTLKNDAYVNHSALKTLYRCLEKTKPKTFVVEDISYFPSHVHQLNNLVVKDSYISTWLFEYIERQYYTCKSIEFLECWAGRQQWNCFIGGLGELPLLQRVKIKDCLVGEGKWEPDDHRGGVMNIEWQGTAGEFGKFCEDLDDV